jgi:hypothetical protein
VLPWSEPGLHLSLRDDEDREIAIVADPEDLDDWPRALPNGDLLIRDVAGDLYRLSSPEEMDKRSREQIWAFVD